MAEPENPFASIEAVRPVLGILNAFRNGLAEANVSPDFQDVMTRDFMGHMYSIGRAQTISGVLDAYPQLGVGASGQSFLAALAALMKPQEP